MMFEGFWHAALTPSPEITRLLTNVPGHAPRHYEDRARNGGEVEAEDFMTTRQGHNPHRSLDRSSFAMD
jgi:hypothetical protein